MLSHLPLDKRHKKLLDLCEIIMGQAPKGDTYNYKNEGAPLIAGAADLGDTFPNPKKFTTAPAKIGRAGDIILCVRATVGDLNWADKSYCYGRGVAGIRPRGNTDSKFIYYWLEANRQKLLSLARGATFKQISKKDIENLPVPNLSLEKQKLVSMHIDQCLIKINELRKLSFDQVAELVELKQSLVFEGANRNENWRRASDLVSWIQDTYTVREKTSYEFAGARSFGKGLFHSATRKSNEFAYRQLRRLQFRDFIYPKLMAWEGAFGMVPKELDGFVVSPEFVIFRPKGDTIIPEVLDTYFRSPHCITDVRNASTGSNRRRRRLNPKAFLTLKVPVPSKSDQNNLRAVYNFENEVQREWKHRDQELQTLRQNILCKAFFGEL